MSPPQLDARGRPIGEPRIPLSYLESLFGDSVGGALETLVAEREKRKQGTPSELMDLLIAYDWNQSFALGPKDAEVSLG